LEVGALMKTNQQLKDLNLPRCDWRTFLKFTPSEDMKFLPQKDADALDEYFKHFLPLNERCVKCGHFHEGILGRFRWSLKHGEGQCSTGGCGWPARGIHYDVGPIKKLEMILQYHPDIVTWEE
jgi:hypothetical protein